MIYVIYIPYVLLYYVAVRVNFSRKDYTAVETEGFVEIRIILSGGTSNISITLTVTPTEHSPISAMGRLYVQINGIIIINTYVCTTL